jgi:sugar phosphate permease
MHSDKNLTVDSRTSWIVWGVAAIFYLYEMVLRASPSVMTEQLMADFHVTSTSLGILVSMYYYAYVSLQVPCGLLVDKMGPRAIVTLSALLCTLGTFLFATTSSLGMAQLGRFLIGAGSACAFISCLKITVEWFTPGRFVLIAGLTNMMGTLGGTFAGKPMAVLVNNFGWRQATVFAGIVGAFVTLISWIFIKDSPHQIQKNDALSSNTFLNSLKFVIGLPQVWLAGIIGGFMYLPISAFTELWAVPFLMTSYGVSNEVASTANIMLYIGMALGGVLTAWLTKKMGTVVGVMKLSALITGCLFAVVAFADHYSLTVMFCLLFMAGLTVGGQILCFTCAKEHAAPEISATTVAFTNALVMFSGIIFQPLLGYILDFVWDGTMCARGMVRVYNHSCYQMAILTIPFCLIASFFLLFWVRDVKQTEEV